MVSNFPRASVTFKQTLPPGFDGLVGVSPSTLFRPKHVETRPAPGVCLMTDGRIVPLDGKSYPIKGGETVTIGGFLALHLRNHHAEPVPVELVVHGVAADIGGDITLRNFAGLAPEAVETVESEPPPAPPSEDEGPACEDCGEPVKADADVPRAIFTSMLSALATQFAPLLWDRFLKPPPPTTEEMFLTHNEVGKIEPPPGEGWTIERQTDTPEGVRTLWTRIVDDSQVELERAEAAVAEASAARAAAAAA